MAAYMLVVRRGYTAVVGTVMVSLAGGEENGIRDSKAVKIALLRVQ